MVLCVCYLENHVFLGTRIDRSTSSTGIEFTFSSNSTFFLEQLRPEVSAKVLHSYPLHPRDLFDHADCLSIVPNLPIRKFNILEAAIERTFVRVAQRRGLQLISELTDDVIAALFPSEKAL